MGAAAFIPLVLSAVGTAASVYNQNQTAHRQDKQLATQLRMDADKQHEADAKTSQLINNVRASSDVDEKEGSLAQFTSAIQANRGNATKPLATQGAVSDAYKKAGSDAALGMATKATGLADLTASIDAPRLQRQNDVRDVDNYNADIGLIRRRSQGDDFLSQMVLRGIKKNPWIDAAAQTAQGFAGKYGGGGSGASSAGGGSNLYSDGSGFTYNLPSY